MSAKKKKKNSRKQNNNSNTVFKVLTIFLLLAAGFVLFNKLKQKDLAEISVNFEQNINEMFLKSGLKNSQIIESYQTEGRKSGRTWIKFTKTIEVQPARLYFYFKSIKKTATDNGLDICSESRNKRQAEIKAGLSGIVLSDIKLKAAKEKHLLAVIVDDLGYSKNIREFIELDIPLTFAILPGEAYSSFLVKELAASGFSYILHMPMEPKDYPENNPGEHALFKNMTREEISRKLDFALQSVKGAAGINNHMGSGFTSDRNAMLVLADEIKKRNLFFIDSATASDSVFKDVFSRVNKCARNNFFIDNKDDLYYIISRMKKLKRLALKREKTIAICHITRKNTAAAIRASVNEMKNAGIEFVTVEEILN